jgi:sodium transport system ATP-binding protein
MIEAVRLTKKYGAVAAAAEVSFTVGAGEVIGLLGPNGAGKTTILRMLAGILTPSAGSARIAGVDVATQPAEAKRRLGFLSGDTALYQRLTPREVLRYFGRLFRIDDSALTPRIAQLVEELRMTDFADRRCGLLSAGQKQKTNIARAFLHDPPALILDEPTATLDVVTGRFLLEAIARARRQGKAILFSTHVMGEAEHLCDRVLFLDHGRVLDQGTVTEVCHRAQAASLGEAFLRRIDEAEGTGPTIRRAAE